MKFFLQIAVVMFLLPGVAVAAQHAKNPHPFNQWLAQFKADARAAGIAQSTLDETFADTEVDESIITLDNKQPETRLTLAQYVRNTVTKKRIQDGTRFLEENKALLTKIGNAYGVQPRFIVALWGIETDFGRNTGNFTTTDALATLAYDGRRAEFFRGELMDALRILEAEHKKAEDMYGSWAGAIGQCQFMPSTYLKYAVDFNKDGKRNVWDDKGDIYASIAHYLQSLGWNKDGGWGRPVKVPQSMNVTYADIKVSKPLSQWQALGVRKADGGNLPPGDMEASLARIGEENGAPVYLVYGNFKSLLQWNRSRYFATAVGTLADAIGQ